jgi:hypothetical protein
MFRCCRHALYNATQIPRRVAMDERRTFPNRSAAALSPQRRFALRRRRSRRGSKISRLDCQLLVRNRSGAKLTANGEAFVVHANQMVQTWDAAKRD